MTHTAWLAFEQFKIESRTKISLSNGFCCLTRFIFNHVKDFVTKFEDSQTYFVSFWSRMKSSTMGISDLHLFGAWWTVFFFLLWTFGSVREGAEWQLPFGITKILLIFVCIRCKLKHFWHIQTSFHLSDISIADQSRTNVFNAVNLVLNQPFPLQFHDCGYFIRKCTYRYVRAWSRDSFGLANYL